MVVCSKAGDAKPVGTAQGTCGIEMGDEVMNQVSSPLPARTATLSVSIVIEATKDRVWEAMIDEVDAWWLPQYRMAPGSKRIVLEPRAGGRFYEESPSGGLLWYTVQMVAAGESIDMHGYLAARYGGPAISLLHISLSELNGKTTITIEDSLIGGFGDAMTTQTHAGWTELFGAGLKAYIERSKQSS
jgi:hypothetical protein